MLRYFDRLIFPEVSDDTRNFLLGMLELEDGGSMIIRNFGKYSPNVTVSHPRRLESSTT